MTTASITTHGHTYEADLDGDRVTISMDGVLAGAGRWRDGSILDCDAVLVRGDADATERVYDALDEALEDALHGEG